MELIEHNWWLVITAKSLVFTFWKIILSYVKTYLSIQDNIFLAVKIFKNKRKGVRKCYIYDAGSQTKPQKYHVTKQKNLRELAIEEKNQIRTFLKKYDSWID